MAKTKGDLVLKALRKAGLYSNATLTDADPQAIEDAINDLEDMMAAWQANQSYTVGTTYTQSEVATLATGLQQARQRILALETALRLHGLID
ncbi:packaged DNA stabilization gp4 family protein [Escherichia coli]